MEEVVLVDEQDRVIANEEKLRAHRNGGKLHRAFSILVCDPLGRMLLQLRSRQKYHFGGLWTNACCGHPRPNEPPDQAARRRLREELGFDTPLREIFSFIYRVDDPESGLTEHEFDHVFLGIFQGTPRPDPREVDDYMWVEPGDLQRDLGRHPGRYAPWFRLAFARAVEHLTTCPTPGVGDWTVSSPDGPGATTHAADRRRALRRRRDPMTKHELKSGGETGRALRPAQAAPVRRSAKEESRGTGQAQIVEPSSFGPLCSMPFAGDDLE